MANTLGSNNPFPSVLFAEHVDPANPSAGTQRLFVDTDHLLKLRDSSGTVVTYPTSSGGTGTLSTVREVDSSPTDSAVTELVFPNGTLAIASHVATYTPSAGISAPSIIGYNTIGGTWLTPGNGLFGKKVTLASAGVLYSIGAYVKGDGTHAATIGGYVMADNAGVPGTLIASAGGPPAFLANTAGYVGGHFLTSTGRWLDLPVGAYLSAASYWLMIICSDQTSGGLSGGNGGMNIAYDGSGSDVHDITGNYHRDVSPPTTNSTRKYSIRGTFGG